MGNCSYCAFLRSLMFPTCKLCMEMRRTEGKLAAFMLHAVSPLCLASCVGELLFLRLFPELFKKFLGRRYGKSGPCGHRVRGRVHKSEETLLRRARGCVRHKASISQGNHRPVLLKRIPILLGGNGLI